MEQRHHLWCAIVARLHRLVPSAAAMLTGFAVATATAQDWTDPPNWYVDGDATSSGDGESWGDAFQTLQEALDAAEDAVANEEGPQIIWVAAATNPYKPHGSDHEVAFVIPPQTTVHGGFDGTENDYDERMVYANETVLSGNLGGGPEVNSLHVVVMNGNGTDAL